MRSFFLKQMLLLRVWKSPDLGPQPYLKLKATSLNYMIIQNYSVRRLKASSPERQDFSPLCMDVNKPALWNRNRRNRNFWTSGTGTGTVTC